MRSVKVWFTGMNEKSAKTSPFFRLLSPNIKMVLKEDCDFLFVDYKDYVYNKSFLKHDCARIFYSTENIFPDYTLVDYAICPNYCPNEDRYHWLPFYWWDRSCWDLLGTKPKDDWISREGFCCFVVSNNNAEPMITQPTQTMREFMFNELSKYKTVDSPGRYKNNCPPIQVDPSSGKDFYTAKIEYMRKYRFALVFENSRAPGYTTEKMVHAYLADCIPIYWGDPKIIDQFEEDTFIWVRDERDVKRAIAETVGIDKSPDEYKKYFQKEKKFKESYQRICSNEYVSDFLLRVMDQDPLEAKRRSRYYLSKTYESRMNVRIFDISSEDKIIDAPISIPLSQFSGHTENVKTSIMDEVLSIIVENDWKGYIVNAAGRFKFPPNPKSSYFPNIPDGAVSVEIRLKCRSQIPILFSPFFMQFDGEKELRTDFKDAQCQNEGECIMEVPIVEGAISYKLAIRLLRGDKVGETFDAQISDIRLSFKCMKKVSGGIETT